MAEVGYNKHMDVFHDRTKMVENTVQYFSANADKMNFSDAQTCLSIGPGKRIIYKYD